MKIQFTLLIAVLVLFSVFASAQPYEFLKTIPVGTSPAGGVALRPNGDLYYVTFAQANSEFIYVPNAILAEEPTKTVIDTASFPALRGYNDIEVDSAGNIFISGTGSSAADSVLKKFGPAPSHTLLWDMQTLGGAEVVRHNGIGLMNDNILAVGAFGGSWNSVGWKDANTGLTLSDPAISGGVNYIRSIAMNTHNNDLYAGKNGDNVNSVLKIFSGGTPSNLSGYTLALDNQLPNLGVATQFGTATQPIVYDPDKNQLIAADANDQSLSPDTSIGVRIYNIVGSGASTQFNEIQFIDGRNETMKYGNVLGLSYAKITTFTPEREFLAISVSSSDIPEASYAIELFRIVPSRVEQWTQY